MATKAYLTPVGISSFITLKEPRALNENTEPKYSLTLIFDKAAQNTAEFRALEKGIEEALKTRWPNKVPPGLRSPFRDGAEKEGIYEGYKSGDIFINPWSKSKPGVVDIQRQDMLNLDEVYAGWTCRATVRPFAYDTAGKRGVSLLLDAVQFLRPGKRLDGRKAAAESFPDDQDAMADEPI
jgi:hypothetical protein